MPDGQCLAMMPASWPAPEGSRKRLLAAGGDGLADGLDDAGVEGDGRVLLEGIDVDADAAPLGDPAQVGQQRRVGAVADGVGRARACRW